MAVHLRELVAAAWLGWSGGVRVGLSAFVNSLSHALATDVLVLFGAAVLLTIAVGRKRSVGRDIDLACVAFVPYLVFKYAATLVFLIAARVPGPTVETAIWVAGLVWCAGVLGAGWQHARGRRLEGAS